MIFVKQKKWIVSIQKLIQILSLLNKCFFLFFGNTGFLPVPSKHSLVLLVINNSSKKKITKKIKNRDKKIIENQV